MGLAKPLLLAILTVIACGSDDDDDANAPRCSALCDEDSCEGESRDSCIDECLVQSEGLQSSCVQCLTDRSEVRARRELGDGEYCYPLIDPPWAICDEVGLNCRPAGDACDDDTLPLSCTLRFASISECTDFCRE